ncbi:MAG TPA: Stp1/IreP family PP2C-type Ser/Thr phosphatase [Vicinamibacterales bacterium]|jgi:protein phosphatase
MLSDVGCQRELNEDAGVIVRPADPEVLDRRGVLAIVADGMGGHAGGEIASRLAVDVIHRSYYESRGPIGDALKTALDEANTEIYRQAQHDPQVAGMGTTCVAVAICRDEASVASVGDSRLYLVRGGRIYQMTTDDSAVGKLVREGALNRADARTHQERNVILRAIGTHESVEISGWPAPFPVRAGDVFLLCSDGLTDLVADAEILALMDAAADEADTCRRLVDAARSRGGFDNITAVVLRLMNETAHAAPVPVTRELKVT